MDWKQQFEIIWEISKKKLAAQGLNISQAKLESLLEVSTGKAQSWKRGQRPSADDLQTMAVKLGLSPSWLLLGQGEPQACDEAPQESVPAGLMSSRLATVETTMREAGAPYLDVLQSLRAMLDGEIAKLRKEQGYGFREERGVSKAAEDRAGYDEDDALTGRRKAAGDDD